MDLEEDNSDGKSSNEEQASASSGHPKNISSMTFDEQLAYAMELSMQLGDPKKVDRDVDTAVASPIKEEQSKREEKQHFSEQTDKNAILMKAVDEADVATLTSLLKYIDELDPDIVSTAQEIAHEKNNSTVSRVLDLMLKKTKGKKGPDVNDETDSPAETQQLTSKLACVICMEDYNDSLRRPRVLTCGHSLCTPCLLNCIVRDMKKCSVCRKTFTAAKVDDIPVNNDLEMVIQLLVQNKSPGVNDEPYSPAANPQPESKAVSLWNQGKMNTDVLEEMLLRPDIANLPVVVLAVGGEFRTGKSFLLCYILRLLRYLDNRREKQYEKVTDNWLGDPLKPLTGFEHKRTPEPVTTGIDIWNEPFIVEKDGNKVAVILMDTQGIFDNQHTLEESYFIFAFSIMVSSVFVYNIPRQLNDHHHIDHLKMFTDYAKQWKTDNSPKDFQNLMFLVRDWDFQDTHDFGIEGGNNMMQEYLKPKDCHQGQVADLRKYIRDTWESIQCYLMPHPGFSATREGYNGNLAGLREEFQIHLKKLIEGHLSPEKLVIKKISGIPITAAELVLHMKSSAKNIEDKATSPSSENLLKVTVTFICDHAKIEAYTKYQDTMVDFVKSSKSYRSEEELQNKSDESYHQIISQYKKATGFGIPTQFPDIVKERMEDLEKECLVNYSWCSLLNDNRKVEEEKVLKKKTLKNKMENFMKISKPTTKKGKEEENSKYVNEIKEEIRETEKEEKSAKFHIAQSEKIARQPWWRSMVNKRKK